MLIKNVFLDILSFSNKMTENAGNIAIESDYVGVKIGYAIGYHFDFDIHFGIYI